MHVCLLLTESVHVIPGSPPYTQMCTADIVQGYNCSLSSGPQRYSLWPTGINNYTVLFNVLGARPISLDVEVVWVDHYPVDLHLSWDPVANNTTALHVSSPHLHSTPFTLHPLLYTP